MVFSSNQAATVYAKELHSVLDGFAALREEKARRLKAEDAELERKAGEETDKKIELARAEILRQAEAEGKKVAERAE